MTLEHIKASSVHLLPSRAPSIPRTQSEHGKEQGVHSDTQKCLSLGYIGLVPGDVISLSHFFPAQVYIWTLNGTSKVLTASVFRKLQNKNTAPYNCWLLLEGNKKPQLFCRECDVISLLLPPRGLTGLKGRKKK